MNDGGTIRNSEHKGKHKAFSRDLKSAARPEAQLTVQDTAG